MSLAGWNGAPPLCCAKSWPALCGDNRFHFSSITKILNPSPNSRVVGVLVAQFVVEIMRKAYVWSVSVACDLRFTVRVICKDDSLTQGFCRITKIPLSSVSLLNVSPSLLPLLDESGASLEPITFLRWEAKSDAVTWSHLHLILLSRLLKSPCKTVCTFLTGGNEGADPVKFPRSYALTFRWLRELSLEYDLTWHTVELVWTLKLRFVSVVSRASAERDGRTRTCIIRPILP